MIKGIKRKEEWMNETNLRGKKSKEEMIDQRNATKRILKSNPIYKIKDTERKEKFQRGE